MSTEIVVAIIGGSFGLLSLAYQAWSNKRGLPTRRTTDQISLVDAGGKIIGNLTEEIDRLEEAAKESRAEADGARLEARACRDENRKLSYRIERLEVALRGAGIDPSTVN
jgi:hypothetical protein